MENSELNQSAEQVAAPEKSAAEVAYAKLAAMHEADGGQVQYEPTEEDGNNAEHSEDGAENTGEAELFGGSVEDEEYIFRIGKGFGASAEDLETIRGVTATARAAGIDAEEVSELNRAFYAGLGEHESDPAAFAMKQNQRAELAEEFLRAQWGESYGANIKAARTQAEKMGILQALARSGLANEPHVIAALVRAANK